MRIPTSVKIVASVPLPVVVFGVLVHVFISVVDYMHTSPLYWSLPWVHRLWWEIEQWRYMWTGGRWIPGVAALCAVLEQVTRRPCFAPAAVYAAWRKAQLSLTQGSR
jgi:hypothetical protein